MKSDQARLEDGLVRVLLGIGSQIKVHRGKDNFLLVGDWAKLEIFVAFIYLELRA